MKSLELRSAAKLLSLGLALSIAGPLEAQGVGRLGIRGGVGIDRTGQTVYVGQVDLIDVGTTHSVELALTAFGARLEEAPLGMIANVPHEYEELTYVEGVAVIGSLLLGHARRERWPYLAAGVGAGALHVDWRLSSPSDPRLGNSRPGGGSYFEESVVKLGGVLQFGVGLRLRERFDVRAQWHGLVVPSTYERKDLKVMSTIILSTGIRF
jgi:hypothetical protein